MEQYIISQDAVSLTDLAEHFQISMNTVRRDLNELQKRGSIRKTYGGVTKGENTTSLQTYSIRSKANPEAKSIIGKLAGSLIEDGDTIFLDSGSTTPYILSNLGNHTNITVISHSLPALVSATRCQNINLISLGGMYNESTSSFWGSHTLDSIADLHISKIFLSTSGISTKGELTNNTYLEAEIKRKIIRQGRQIILLADQTKFDKTGMITYATFQDLDVIATDGQPSRNYQTIIQRNKIRLLCP